MKKTLKAVVAIAVNISVVCVANAQVKSISSESFSQVGQDEAYWVAEVTCSSGPAQIIQRKTDGDKWCSKAAPGKCNDSKQAAAKMVCSSVLSPASSAENKAEKDSALAADAAKAEADAEANEAAALAKKEAALAKKEAALAKKEAEAKAQAAKAEKEAKAKAQAAAQRRKAEQKRAQELARAERNRKAQIEEQLIKIEQEKLELRGEELELQKRAVEIKALLSKKN